MTQSLATITVRQVSDQVFTLYLQGEITASAEASLTEAYTQANVAGARVIILNFGRMEYMNSSGISLLVIMLAQAEERGQRLFAVELNEHYREIFEITQLHEGIPIYPTEAEAVRAAEVIIGAPITPAPPPPQPDLPLTPDRVTVVKSPEQSWAQPVDRLKVTQAPAGARNLNVDGRTLLGPLQGFGQMWQKTYRIRLDGTNLTPHEVIEIWKQRLPEFKPPQKRFYPSSMGIKPNELVLIDAQTPGGPISTGVMVLYAGAESFTLMTPAGHPESGWVTFSAYTEDGRTIAQIQLIVRASDPVYEMAFRLIGSKVQDDIWTHVLTALADHLGATGQVEMHKTLVDSDVQWSRAGNIWHNAQIRTLIHMPRSLAGWITTRLGQQGRRKGA
jgi:anti-anti-sigma factor